MQGDVKIRWSDHFLMAILALGIFWTCYVPSQSDFTNIILGYSLSFGAYILLVRGNAISLNLTLIMSFAIALIPVFSFPNLSNDIYRFIWDGAASSNGINPYEFTPSQIKDRMSSFVDLSLLELMNSRDYHSVYPAFCQMLYIIAYKAGASIEIQALVLKLLYFAIHGLGLYYLYRIIKRENLPASSFLIYALNPLVIVEGIGNLHAEIMMVALLFGFYFFYKNKASLAALFLSLSIATKLLPVLLLPYLFFNRKNKGDLKVLRLLIPMLIVLFIPMILGLNLVGFGSGLNLYFQKFEFNASVYYILRYLGHVLSGYNLILYLGPILAMIAAFFIFRKSVKPSITKADSFKYLFASLVLYFLIATTIHPWYVIGLLGLGVFTKYSFQMVWSYLIILTYLNYSYPVYHENLWIVFVEYAVLMYLIYKQGFVNEFRSVTHAI